MSYKRKKPKSIWQKLYDVGKAAYGVGKVIVETVKALRKPKKEDR